MVVRFGTKECFLPLPALGWTDDLHCDILKLADSQLSELGERPFGEIHVLSVRFATGARINDPDSNMFFAVG